MSIRDKAIKIAIIDGVKVNIDFSHSQRSGYDEQKHLIKYLGSGQFDTINGAKQKEIKLFHFWKKII